LKTDNQNLLVKTADIFTVYYEGFDSSNPELLNGYYKVGVNYKISPRIVKV
jgi:hypothetical protein